MNERIKAVRAALGLSQQEFAEKLSVAPLPTTRLAEMSLLTPWSV